MQGLKIIRGRLGIPKRLIWREKHSKVPSDRKEVQGGKKHPPSSEVTGTNIFPMIHKEKKGGKPLNLIIDQPRAGSEGEEKKKGTALAHKLSRSRTV